MGSGCSARWVLRNTRNMPRHPHQRPLSARVINDILDMSKIEAGRMKLDMEQVDLSKTLAESLRVVPGRADDKRLMLDRMSTAPFRWSPTGARSSRSSSTCSPTPSSSRPTAARWWSAADCAATGFIVLMIADTGIGIAPQSLPRLGRPFEQVESQLTKTYHGSGLGLRSPIAHQSARRIDAATLEARYRHRGLRVLAARRASGQRQGGRQQLDGRLAVKGNRCRQLAHSSALIIYLTSCSDLKVTVDKSHPFANIDTPARGTAQPRAVRFASFFLLWAKQDRAFSVPI